MSNQASITSLEIQEGRKVAAAELLAARETLDAACYALARDRSSSIVQSRVAAAREEVSRLESELAGLAAVARFASKQERIDNRQAAAAKLHQQEADALQAIDAVPAAYERASAHVAALALALAELDQVVETARVQLVRLNPVAAETGLLSGVPRQLTELGFNTWGGRFDSAGMLTREPGHHVQQVARAITQSRTLLAAGVAARSAAFEE